RRARAFQRFLEDIGAVGVFTAFWPAIVPPRRLFSVENDLRAFADAVRLRIFGWTSAFVKDRFAVFRFAFDVADTKIKLNWRRSAFVVGRRLLLMRIGLFGDIRWSGRAGLVRIGSGGRRRRIWIVASLFRRFRRRLWKRDLDWVAQANLAAARIDGEAGFDDEAQLRAVGVWLDLESADDAPAVQFQIVKAVFIRVVCLLIGEIARGEQLAFVVVIATQCRNFARLAFHGMCLRLRVCR